MNFDQVVDHEFHPREAYSARGKAPPAHGGGRTRDIQHHIGFGLGQIRQVELDGFELERPFIDRTAVAFRA